MKTVRVRIAVAISPAGRWYAYGSFRSSDEEAAKVANAGDAVIWVEADVPVPEGTAVIEGSIVP